MLISQKKGFITYSLLVSSFVLLVLISGPKQAVAADAALGVTQITAERSSATADNNFTSGWKWLFNVTVPTNETLLQMKFADWINGTHTIAVPGNMRIYSAQSTDMFDADHALLISQTNAYGDAVMHLDTTKDLSSIEGGRQVQIAVETKIPSGTSDGSYATSYGINTTQATSTVVTSSILVSAASDNPAAGTIEVSTSEYSAPMTVLAFDLANSEASDTPLSALSFKIATSTTSGIGSSLGSLIKLAVLIVNGTHYTGTISSTNGIIRFRSLGITLPAHTTTEGTLTLVLGPQAGHYSATGTSLSASLIGSSNTIVATSTTTGLGATVSGSAIGSVQTLVIPQGLSIAAGDTSATLTYNSTTPAHSYGTFTIKFDLTAVGDDLYIPKMIASTTAASSIAGVVVDFNGAQTLSDGSVETLALSTTADTDNSGYYVIHDGETETFTVTAAIDPSYEGDYQIGLDKVRFSLSDLIPITAGALQTLEVDQNDSQFQTDPLHIPNS